MTEPHSCNWTLHSRNMLHFGNSVKTVHNPLFGTMNAPLHAVLPAMYRLQAQPAERFNRYRFTVHVDDEEIGRGTHFTGTRHIKPWIELQPAVTFHPANDDDQNLFDALVAVLDPGGHLMIHYLQDEGTAKSITANVPPPATALGFLMWQAGIRWFKDWYFTEGWMEGDQKLQGNLPLNDDVKQEREKEWHDVLNAFISEENSFPKCQKRAQRILKSL